MSRPSTWHRLVDAIQPLRPAVRVKWTGDSEPTRWEPWIIISSVSYLETGTLGPVPFGEVEWVEVDPRLRNIDGRLVACDRTDSSESVLAALKDVDLCISVVDGNIRIVANDA